MGQKVGSKFGRRRQRCLFSPVPRINKSTDAVPKGSRTYLQYVPNILPLLRMQEIWKSWGQIKPLSKY